MQMLTLYPGNPYLCQLPETGTIEQEGGSWEYLQGGELDSAVAHNGLPSKRGTVTLLCNASAARGIPLLLQPPFMPVIGLGILAAELPEHSKVAEILLGLLCRC